MTTKKKKKKAKRWWPQNCREHAYHILPIRHSRSYQTCWSVIHQSHGHLALSAAFGVYWTFGKKEKRGCFKLSSFCPAITRAIGAACRNREHNHHWTPAGQSPRSALKSDSKVVLPQLHQCNLRTVFRKERKKKKYTSKKEIFIARSTVLPQTCPSAWSAINFLRSRATEVLNDARLSWVGIFYKPWKVGWLRILALINNCSCSQQPYWSRVWRCTGPYSSLVIVQSWPVQLGDAYHHQRIWRAPRIPKYQADLPLHATAFDAHVHCLQPDLEDHVSTIKKNFFFCS